jgi:hypothetical protein
MAGLLAASSLLGCQPTSKPPPPLAWTEALEREATQLEARLAVASPGPSGAVRVHLAFSEAVDLDLYVTGPRAETVYYANSPSAIGGELIRDLRCQHTGPRTETIQFRHPAPGRYRVGVDYPHACRGEAGAAAFVVLVETPSGRTLRRGLAALQVFEPIVLEFDLASEEIAHAR